MKRSAFSLIELLVVMFIISMFLGFSVTYLSGAKARAKGIECQKNLSDWAKALGMYIDESRIHAFPAHGETAGETNAWYNVLAQNLDIRPLYAYGENDRIPAPKSGIKSMYVCPLASKGSGDNAIFSYAINKDTAGLRVAKVREASAFIVFMDAPDPTHSSVSVSQVLGQGSDCFRHGGRMNAAFLDGSVRALDRRQIRAGSDDPKKVNEHGIYWDPIPDEE